MTEGGGVNSKSHIFHGWSPSLRNIYEKQVGKFTAKQKKLILRSPREKEAILRVFSTYLGSSGTLGNSKTN